MSKKQLFVDRNLDQLDHVGSKIFCAQIVEKGLDYKTQTFNFLCLSDSGRQTHFFPDFLIFETQNFDKCIILKILPIKYIDLVYRNEKPRF